MARIRVSLAYFSIFISVVVSVEVLQDNGFNIDIKGKLDLSNIIDINGNLGFESSITNQSFLDKLIENNLSKFMSRNKDENKQMDKNQRNCFDHYKMGDLSSGLKVIYPYRNYPQIPKTVYCDQETDGGGWTVIQRRVNISQRENFYRSWAEYRLGFGKKDQEFWLGNDVINELTSIDLQKLRIDLETYEGDKRWAKYGFFHLDDNENKFKLTVGDYKGTAGDSMTYHHGMLFSTRDQDNDKSDDSCANE